MKREKEQKENKNIRAEGQSAGLPPPPPRNPIPQWKERERGKQYVRKRVENFSKQMTDINPQSYKSKTQQTRSVKIWFLKTTKTGKYLMRHKKLKGEKVKINYTRNENREHNYRDLKHGRTLWEIFHLKKLKIWRNTINLPSWKNNLIATKAIKSLVLTSSHIDQVIQVKSTKFSRKR